MRPRPFPQYPTSYLTEDSGMNFEAKKRILPHGPKLFGILYPLARTSCLRIVCSALICMSSDHRDGRGFYNFLVFHLIERSFYLYGV